MQPITTLALLASIASAIPFSPLTARDNPPCAPFHLIVARGTTEAPGEGEMGSIAQQVTSQIPGSDSVGLDYPAAFFPTYWDSESQGVSALANDLSSYASSCPDSKIGLMGFSQGAQVVMDVLCGSSEIFEASSNPLSGAAASRISSVVLFGDPSHVPGQSYDKGTGTTEGVFPRQNTAGCDAFADVIQSYCDNGDPFCDLGDNLFDHIGDHYPDAYGADAVNFAVSKFNAAKSKS